MAVAGLLSVSLLAACETDMETDTVPEDGGLETTTIIGVGGEEDTTTTSG